MLLVCIRGSLFAVTAGRGAPRHGCSACHVPRGALGCPEVLPASSLVIRIVTHGCRRSWDHSRVTPAPTHRVSARLSAIAPSPPPLPLTPRPALKAAGRPVIGFGAESLTPTPDYISVEAAIAAAKDPANHKYFKGLPVLREAIAAKTLRDGYYEASRRHPWSPTAAKQAVFQAFALVPGDEVLLARALLDHLPGRSCSGRGHHVEVFAGPTRITRSAPISRCRSHRAHCCAAALCRRRIPTGSAPHALRS